MKNCIILEFIKIFYLKIFWINKQNIFLIHINLLLPLDVQIDLLNKTIKPILLYGCEILCVGNIEGIERVQLKFYKQILNLKKATPSHMIYGELPNQTHTEFLKRVSNKAHTFQFFLTNYAKRY